MIDRSRTSALAPVLAIASSLLLGVAAAPASLSAFVPVAEAITIALFVGLIVTVFFFVESRMGSVPVCVSRSRPRKP